MPIRLPATSNGPDLQRRDALQALFGAALCGVSHGVLHGPRPAAAANDAPPASAAPRVAVSRVRRAFHNGEHNAFTDLCRFGDHLYLTFRSCPDGHMVHPTSSIIVLRSANDGTDWEQVHRFRVADRDPRDPHFLVFRERLFVYSGTWYSGKATLPREEYDLNKHLGYAAWTADGNDWHGPVLLEGTFGHYIWRAAAHGDRAYLCGRRKPQFEVLAPGEPRNTESLMLESEDGLIWRRRAVFRPEQGDETAFQFEADGSLIAVARTYSNQEAQLLMASPPYSEVRSAGLGRAIGGPLLARWGGRYVVGGRKTQPGQGPTTFLAWLADGQLSEFAELPSGGDCSYPGLVELSPTRALVSWYSSHEHGASGEAITAIYLAELEIPR
jgi:hypothetical protein